MADMDKEAQGKKELSKEQLDQWENEIHENARKEREQEPTYKRREPSIGEKAQSLYDNIVSGYSQWRQRRETERYEKNKERASRLEKEMEMRNTERRVRQLEEAKTEHDVRFNPIVSAYRRVKHSYPVRLIQTGGGFAPEPRKASGKRQRAQVAKKEPVSLARRALMGGEGAGLNPFQKALFGIQEGGQKGHSILDLSSGGSRASSKSSMLGEMLAGGSSKKAGLLDLKGGKLKRLI